MKIAIIGSRGWSYAGVEDMVRAFGPKFVRDGHELIIHGRANEETRLNKVRVIEKDGIKTIFHETTKGKFLAQLVVAIKSSIMAAFSDCDLIIYLFIQNGIYSWLPRIMGKKIITNVDGIMWRDPKWPPVFRHIFFPIGAYLTMIFSHKTLTDSFHMQQLYKKKFLVNIDWIGYGCDEILIPKMDIDLNNKFPTGYYLIMSRLTPHNSTHLMVEGFIKSKSKKHLILAGHTPDSKYVNQLKKIAEWHNVTFLGLVKDQDYLTQIILNSSAYLHGHSLGGINPALVRVVGLNIPVICLDTVFNREIIEYPNKKIQAVLFTKDTASVINAIEIFEKNEEKFKREAKNLGATIHQEMSWEKIYQEYLKIINKI